MAEVAAGRLLQRFGSPSRMISAPSEAILDTLPDSPELGASIIAARNFADFAATAVIIGERIDPRSSQMRRFLVATLGRRETEAVLAIFLDGNCAFLTHELIAMGSEVTATFPIRLLVAQALEVGSRGIVLAHNHPSGHAAPSEQDHRTTDHIRALSASLGIDLLDHLIVARNQVFSMAKGTQI